MKNFETENLKIRKFKMEDVEDVHRNLATESQLAECLGYNIHKSIHETETMVASLYYLLKGIYITYINAKDKNIALPERDNVAELFKRKII